MPKISPQALLNILVASGLVSRPQASTAAPWVSLLASALASSTGNPRSKIRRSDLPPGVWDHLDALFSLLNRGQIDTSSPASSESSGRSSTLRAPPGSPGGFTTRSGPAPDPRVSPTTRFPRRPPTAAEEESEWSDIFLTPTSSNVYSFQYHRRPGDTHGTLFVTYKASTFHEGALSTGTRRKGRSRSQTQLVGKAGKTIAGKSNAPGPRYAYLQVPPAVFTRMKDAYSKGKFIWDNIRVRGTIYGHKYQYTLAQGQIVEGMGRMYIPRKATSQGFRTRSVRTGSTGRGGFQTSTLAESTSGGGGFSTRPAPRR